MSPFHYFQLFLHHLSLSFISYNNIIQRSYTVSIADTVLSSRVENFQARYDHSTDAIYIQWSYPEHLLNDGFISETLD